MDKTKTLVDVKIALAEKYERRAMVSGSKPKRHAFTTQAVKYRRQAEQIRRDSK